MSKRGQASGFDAATTIGTILGEYSIHVDRSKSVEELLAQRSWTYVSPQVSSRNFRVGGGTEQRIIELVHFDRLITTAEAERQLAARDLALPDMHQELSFATQCSAAWANRVVVFLGAAWVGPSSDRGAGLLRGLAGCWYCHLTWPYPNDRWDPHYVFAGVRK